MRIAIVLFGNLRSYRQTISSFQLLKNTLAQVGLVDVFCHTWDIEESVTAAWWKEAKPGDVPAATVNEEEIVKTYSPSSYRIESSRQFDERGYNVNSTIPIPGILSMLYSQSRAFELLREYEKKNGFEYDVVLKTRYDLLYEIAPDFIKCITAQDCLFLPSSNPFELAGSCGDIFAIGSGKSMEKYFSFCWNFKDAIKIYQQKGYRKLIPELCMTVYLDHLSVKRYELKGLRIHILRMNGDKFQVNSDKNFEENNPLVFTEVVIDRNSELFVEGSDNIEASRTGLAKKYTSWIDPEADEKLLNDYAAFYRGKWVGSKKIIRLAKKSKTSKALKSSVMKSFFEGAMRNATYGGLKKFIIAQLLYLHSAYGMFFFRVWKNLILNKN